VAAPGIEVHETKQEAAARNYTADDAHLLYTGFAATALHVDDVCGFVLPAAAATLVLPVFHP
jgi:hypothetical protein